MKRKILNAVIDLALIMGILVIGDILALKVLHCEKIWLDIVLYIVLYIVIFGIKHWIVTLWKRKKSRG